MPRQRFDQHEMDRYNRTHLAPLPRRSAGPDRWTWGCGCGRVLETDTCDRPDCPGCACEMYLQDGPGVVAAGRPGCRRR